MIAHIRGTLLEKHPNAVIVECSGVGYELAISVATYSELPEEGATVALFVHTHVREDQFALFGFLAKQEKALFEKLFSVSGIGPKLAITILSGMSVPEMIAALRSGDVTRLTKIPGIGKKTAERMVLELKDKLAEFGSAKPEQPTRPVSALEDDVLSALINLGYQQQAAEKALTGLGVPNGRTFEQLFRAAMASLSK